MPIWEYADATERSPEEIAQLQLDLLAALREAVGAETAGRTPPQSVFDPFGPSRKSGKGGPDLSQIWGNSRFM